MATLPVATSISTKSMTSIRRLQRSVPASEPKRSRSNRPSSPHGTSPGRVHGTDTPRPGRVPEPLEWTTGGALLGVGVAPEGSGESLGSPVGSSVGSSVGSVVGGSVASGGSVGSGSGVAFGSTVANVSSKKALTVAMYWPAKAWGTTTSNRTPTANAPNVAALNVPRRARSRPDANRQMPRMMLSTASAGSTPGVTRISATPIVPLARNTASAATTRSRKGTRNTSPARRRPASRWPRPGMMRLRKVVSFVRTAEESGRTRPRSNRAPAERPRIISCPAPWRSMRPTT
jgi:hypothetical protein